MTPTMRHKPTRSWGRVQSHVYETECLVGLPSRAVSANPGCNSSRLRGKMSWLQLERRNSARPAQTHRAWCAGWKKLGSTPSKHLLCRWLRPVLSPAYRLKRMLLPSSRSSNDCLSRRLSLPAVLCSLCVRRPRVLHPKSCVRSWDDPSSATSGSLSDQREYLGRVIVPVPSPTPA